MEIVLIAVIVIVVLLILGIPVANILFGVLAFMDLMAFASFLFFVLSFILVLISKKKEAQFLRLDKSEHFGEHAVYETEYGECKNLFPTDAGLGNILYRKTDAKVRICKWGKRHILLDRISLLVIGIGLPAFFILTVGILQILLKFF